MLNALCALITSLITDHTHTPDLSLSPQPMSVLSDQSDFSSSAHLWDKHEEDGERSASKMFASDDSSESLLSTIPVEQSYPRPVAVSVNCECVRVI